MQDMHHITCADFLSKRGKNQSGFFPQTAEPVKLASLMVNHYGEEYAVQLTLQVLRAINQHLLAEELHRVISPGKRPQVPSSFSHHPIQTTLAFPWDCSKNLPNEPKIFPDSTCILTPL